MMPETYPTDVELLAIDQDTTTGVEFIPTGASPYVIPFRKLMQRLLLATQRANDLRVYQDGPLSVGVREGRCVIEDNALAFGGTTGITLAASTTTLIWLDASGTVESGAFPSDRSTYLPLAEVVTDATQITTLTDRRGEAFLQASGASAFGITATVDEINTALDGIGDSVHAAALTSLTNADIVDGFHHHTLQTYDQAGVAEFLFYNPNSDPSAGARLTLYAPGSVTLPTSIDLDATTGFLTQVRSGETLHLIGGVTVHETVSGAVTASFTDRLTSPVPIDGVITRVVLSVQDNLQSSTAGDGLEALVKVNGNLVTTTHPALTSADGSGMRCTDQGDGTASIIDPAEASVTRGDLLTLDLTRTANGSISNQAHHVAVMVCIDARQPH